MSNAPLTLHDIDGICEAFATVLNGAFHDRIEYPAMDMPKRNAFGLDTQRPAQPAEKKEKPAEAPAAATAPAAQPAEGENKA